MLEASRANERIGQRCVQPIVAINELAQCFVVPAPHDGLRGLHHDATRRCVELRRADDKGEFAPQDAGAATYGLGPISAQLSGTAANQKRDVFGGFTDIEQHVAGDVLGALRAGGKPREVARVHEWEGFGRDGLGVGRKAHFNALDNLATDAKDVDAKEHAEPEQHQPQRAGWQRSVIHEPKNK